MLLLLGMATYKSATFFEQFAVQRMLHDQRVALHRGLLEYGIRVVIAHYQEVLKLDQAWDLTIDAPDCAGTITIQKIQQEIEITARMISPGHRTESYRCLVGQNQEGKMYARGFQET